MIADYFLRCGLLTKEQADSATRYIGFIENDRHLMSVGNLVDDPEFGRTETCRFIDWLILNGLASEFTLTAFITRAVKELARSKAQQLNQRTLKAFRRKGLDYYVDAISAAALCVLFGGSYRRILRLEMVQKLPAKEKYTLIRVKNGKEYEERKKVRCVLVNGTYKVQASKIFREFAELETGEFFVINESRWKPDIWHVGRKLVTRASMVQIAIGIAKSNFVGMEVGRFSQKVCELTSEHRDIRRSRSVDYHWDVIAASHAFCDTNRDLTPQERNILRVELGRPLESEPDAYAFYVAQSGDKPYKSPYYRMLKKARETMLQQFNDEDF